jgi:hypothetical protein
MPAAAGPPPSLALVGGASLFGTPMAASAGAAVGFNFGAVSFT